MRNIILFILLCFFSVSSYSQNYSSSFSSIEKHLDSVLKQWNIPGLAVGIVHKDKLIYSKGFGFRDLEKKLPVNAATTFPIASNSKLFTAVLGGILQEEKLLDLDKPVTKYLPEIRFATDELNVKLNTRDLLSHRSGVPGYDALWLYGSWPKDSLLSRLHLMTPRYSLREGYIYNNVMYSVAGSVMEKVTGKSWENLVREKIFNPLGMNRSGFSNEIKTLPDNHSLSYMEKDNNGRILPRPVSGQSEALGPAGTIYSSVEDMSKWMIALLNEGKFAGKQVIPANAIKQTAVPLIISDRTGRWDELSNGLYGMGRIMQSYKGIKILMHTGSIDNFYSNLTVIPSKDLAIFIVFNTNEASSYRTVAALPVIDRLLGLETTDWSGRYRKEFEQSRSNSGSGTPPVNVSADTKPYHPLEEYTGYYTDPLLGTLSVVLKDNVLRLNFKDFDFPLFHHHFDQFVTRQPRGVPDYRVIFQTGSNGKVNGIKMNVYGIEGNFNKQR